MTPAEAKAKYEAEWPALHAAKEAAETLKDAKKCRQALSALSQRCAARFELNKPEPDECNAGLDAIAYMLYLETWLNSDESLSELEDELLKRLYEKWVTQWLPGRSGKHCGDCTKVAGPCLRCGVERLYEEAARIQRVSNAKLTSPPTTAGTTEK